MDRVKVVVAMSGGVDSSVAAVLLKEQVYRVIGVTMNVWQNGSQSEADRFGGCCGVSAVEDAKKVAHMLGIPHYTMNFREVFVRRVIDYFCDEYRRGRTPNPCIRCNQYIKFDALVQKARELGADRVATGHYARIERDGGGRYLLKKGLDARKDQSYFLYTMTQEQLSHTLMPVGGLTKDRVREIARELGLPVAAKPESQEICFIPDDDYARFLRKLLPGAATPGAILDEEGHPVGQHRGILAYTVGQRRGLGISSRAPLYVTAIRPEDNAIVVGAKEAVYGRELVASGVNWIGISCLSEPIRARAKIRYLHREAEVVITPLGEDKIEVEFDEPQMAITPGQAVVIYDGDMVLGGGTIEKAEKRWLKS